MAQASAYGLLLYILKNKGQLYNLGAMRESIRLNRYFQMTDYGNTDQNEFQGEQ